MEIQASSTFEQLLKAERLNAKKSKSYYQQKQLRAFHKQVIIKQQIYDNMLETRSWMEYSQGIQFQTSLINMEEAKEITMNNQKKLCRCGSVKHLHIFSKDCPVGIAIRNAKNRPWRWRHLNPKQTRHQKMQKKRKTENVWQQRPQGSGEAKSARR